MTNINRRTKEKVPSVPKEEIGYSHKIFIQSLFPYRATDEHLRVLGQGALQVTLMSPHGLPYGKYPRLIMAYIITTALKHNYQYEKGHISLDKAREIPLGDSLNGFFYSMGITSPATGGTSGSGTRLKEQLHRVVSSTITVEKRIKSGDDTEEKGENQSIAESWQFWSNTKTGAITSGKLTISKSFFKIITDTNIPIHLPTLQKIKKPRAIDLYFWTTIKQFEQTMNNKDAQTFSWNQIAHQFSLEQPETSAQWRNFRTRIRECVEEINGLWPESGLEVDSKRGVTITTTHPHIPIQPGKRSLVKSA